jgi:hypothetical protein
MNAADDINNNNNNNNNKRIIVIAMEQSHFWETNIYTQLVKNFPTFYGSYDSWRYVRNINKILVEHLKARGHLWDLCIVGIVWKWILNK